MKALKNFLAKAPTKKFKKNEIFVQQGKKLKQTYVVKTGVVRCYDISLDGNQQLIWLASEGEILPISQLFDIDEETRFFYSAFSNIEVYVTNKDELADFMKKNPDILFEVCAEITRKFSDLHYRVNATAKLKSREKILHTLAFIADRFKNRKRSEQVELSLPLTHQDIASLVGLTRETTATTLKKLKDEGYINYNKDRFLVYRDKIEEML